MEQKQEIQISVRGLVEFLLRSGDLDNRHHAGADTAMQEGSRIHREIQKAGGPGYRAEVSLQYRMETENYDLVVEGRADGVIAGYDSLTIEEIKGTYRDINHMKEPVPVHLAQAKCYARMILPQTDAKRIMVRVLYCNLETEEKRSFVSEYTGQELEDWFAQLLTEYRKWADFMFDWKQKRDASIQKLEFPYPYRKGQKELVTYVYQTVFHRKKLFIEAPTGVGKTLSVIFPTVKAMERGLAEKFFYLTAKTVTATVADETFGLLAAGGIRLKSILLTAKEKVCILEHPECNPDLCERAKGHFDRINAAIYEMLQNEDRYTREVILSYAERYRVCPFELSLDVSLFCDGIIGDYNYLFDPHVYLKRFFAESGSRDYIFLIDEAHNLLERGREMYSAVLVKEDFLRLKNALLRFSQSAECFATVLGRDGYANAIIKALEHVNKGMLALKRECEEFQVADDLDSLYNQLLYLRNKMESYLEEQEDKMPEVRQDLLDLYFDVCHFMDIYDLMDERYVKYTQYTQDGTFLVKLLCVDPSNNLNAAMQRGRSSILFSATFLPIQYYKALLGGEKTDYEVYANSVFAPEKRKIVIARDVTSRYSRRGEREYERIAAYIQRIAAQKKGNYMVFFPSYQFLEAVYTVFTEKFQEKEVCLSQKSMMDEWEREEFLSQFQKTGEETLIGFCVLGGIFSEGIDLKKDSLIGVVIVGTGLPLVCHERELLKSYFDEEGKDGFDYSYRFPGMNKVLQAAGRVIRTEEDVGVIALLDDRFGRGDYESLFPKEWENTTGVTLETVGEEIRQFWRKWE